MTTEPDMIQQAGQLLAMLQAGKPICHGMSASSGDDRAIVQASAAWPSPASCVRSATFSPTACSNTQSTPCRILSRRANGSATTTTGTPSCGLLWIIEDGTSPAANDMRYCPNCGSSIAVEEAFIGEDGAV